jgi:streptogramin lyase
LAPSVAALLAVLVSAPLAAAGVNKVTEFSVGITAGSGLAAIAPGPEGDLWFTESAGNRIGRITPAGVVSEFSAGITPGSAPDGITLGGEGDLWFTESAGNRIGRITPAGAVTEFSAGISVGSSPRAIVKGQEGELWFTEGAANRIGRITPSGEVTQFEDVKRKSDPLDIAVGGEGDLWFTEEGANRIGRITPSGEVSEFANGVSDRPQGIALGPDGNLWFTDSEGHRMGRITPTGEAKKFSAGISPASGLDGIAAGADGNLWFTESVGDRIGRIVSTAPPAVVSAPVLSGGTAVGKPARCVAGTWASWISLAPSPSLFAFDGYRWLLDGSLVATGPAYTPGATSAGRQLSCSETVTYPLLDVSASATSAPATVVAAVPLLVGPRRGGANGGIGYRGFSVAPSLSAVSESTSTWREGAKLASIARASGPPIGASFSFTLNELARVAFVFTQRVSGREVKGRCTAATTKNSHDPRCERTATVGVLAFSGRNGRDRLSFQGRISRSKRLPPGRYALHVTATNAAGQRSQTRTVSFTIVA